MQEKRVHIDEKFTDQAWADMRSLLDRELPVANGRRLGLAWWWAFVAGLAIVAGAAYWHFANPADKAKPVAGQPIAQQNNSQAGNLPETPAIAAVGGNEKPLPVLDKNEANAPVASPSFSKNVLRSKNTGGRLALGANTPPSKIVENLPSAHSAVESSKSRTMDKATAQLMPAAVQAAEETKTAVTNPIRIGEKDLQLIDNQAIAQFGVVSSITSAKHWTWSFQGNGNAVSSLTGMGAGIGFNLKRDLSNKLGLQTGLGYDYLKQPIYAGISAASIIEQSNSKVFYADPSLSADFIFDTNLSNVESRFLKLHYLTIPLDVVYSIGKRWEANLGGTLGLLLTSSSVYVQDGLLDRAGLGLSSEDRSSTKPAKVALTDLAITGGFGFKLNRTWSLYLNYAHGMTDILPDNNTGDHNRLIKLGIRYKLNQGR